MSKRKIIVIVILLFLIAVLGTLIGYSIKSMDYLTKMIITQQQCTSIIHSITIGIDTYKEKNHEYPENINSIIAEYIKEEPPLLTKPKENELINNWNNPIIIGYENEKDVVILKLTTKSKCSEHIYELRYDKNGKKWFCPFKPKDW